MGQNKFAHYANNNLNKKHISKTLEYIYNSSNISLNKYNNFSMIHIAKN